MGSKSYWKALIPVIAFFLFIASFGPFGGVVILVTVCFWFKMSDFKSRPLKAWAGVIMLVGIMPLLLGILAFCAFYLMGCDLNLFKVESNCSPHFWVLEDLMMVFIVFAYMTPFTVSAAFVIAAPLRFIDMYQQEKKRGA